MALKSTIEAQAASRQIMGVKWKPKDGLVWSPLSRYPANAKCFCGSGKKFKKCHKDQVKMAVKPEEAEQLKKYVDMVKAEGLNR